MNSNEGFEFKVGQKFRLNRRWSVVFKEGSIVTIDTIRDVDELDKSYDINEAGFGNGEFAIRGAHLRRGDATLVEDVPSVQPDELLKEMNDPLITGAQSAYWEAKTRGHGNMLISCNLVIDLVEALNNRCGGGVEVTEDMVYATNPNMSPSRARECREIIQAAMDIYVKGEVL